MNGASEGPDMLLLSAAAAAVRAARAARDSLFDRALPVLSPQRRGFPTHVLRHLERGTFRAEDVLRDIEALTDSLRREIAEGTHIDWQGDENHVHGGWEFIHLEDHAAALAGPARDLEALCEAIADALDMARATASSRR